MTESAHPSAKLDESAVAAVRGGDAERYRELVERHERRVYAVAWIHHAVDKSAAACFHFGGQT